MDSTGDRVIVRNPARALFSTDRWKLRKVWSRSLGWGGRLPRVWEPEPAVRASGRELFVLDPVEKRVEVRAADDGRLLRTFGGGVGGEPGELGWPRSMALTDQAVVVADSSEIEIFDRSGESVRQVPVPDRVLEVYATGETGFLAFEYARGGVRWRSYASPLAEGEPYPPPVTTSETHPAAAESDCWQMEGLTDGLLLLSCAHPVLLRFDRDGRILREIALGRAPEEPSDEELEALRRNVRLRADTRRPGLDEEVVERLVDREVRRHPFTKRNRAVRHDPSRGLVAVLEQTPDYMGGGEAEVLLLTTEGMLLGRLAFDRHFLDFDLREGRLYVLAPGRAGTDPTLAAYELEVPSAFRGRSGVQDGGG